MCAPLGTPRKVMTQWATLTSGPTSETAADIASSVSKKVLSDDGLTGRAAAEQLGSCRRHASGLCHIST